MKTYTIKPLEWDEMDDMIQCYQTLLWIGYRIYPKVHGFRLRTMSLDYHGEAGNNYYYYGEGGGYSEHDTIDEAKAAAETHYIEQMEKGLARCSP